MSPYSSVRLYDLRRISKPDIRRVTVKTVLREPVVFNVTVRGVVVPLLHMDRSRSSSIELQYTVSSIYIYLLVS